MVEISPIFFFLFNRNKSLFPKRSRKKQKQKKACPCGLSVSVSFNTVCSVLSGSHWQFGGASKNPLLRSSPITWICRLHDRESKLRKKSRRSVPRSVRLCYTGGRGEIPHLNEAIQVPEKKHKKQTILDRVLWLKQGFSRLTRGCVCLGWEGRGRTRPPPLSSRYGSVRGAVSGYGISRWSPSTLHVVVVHAHITA